jgi:hypothetical protein
MLIPGLSRGIRRRLALADYDGGILRVAPVN